MSLPKRPFNTSSITSTLKSTIASQPLLSNLANIDKLSSQASSLAQKTPFFANIQQPGGGQNHAYNPPSNNNNPTPSSSHPSNDSHTQASLHGPAQQQASTSSSSGSNMMMRGGQLGGQMLQAQQRPPVASTPTVDMSHLTEEERLIVESVMAKAEMADMGIPVDTSGPPAVVAQQQARQQQQSQAHVQQQQQQKQQQHQQQHQQHFAPAITNQAQQQSKPQQQQQQQQQHQQPQQQMSMIEQQQANRQDPIQQQMNMMAAQNNNVAVQNNNVAMQNQSELYQQQHLALSNTGQPQQQSSSPQQQAVSRQDLLQQRMSMMMAAQNNSMTMPIQNELYQQQQQQQQQQIGQNQASLMQMQAMNAGPTGQQQPAFNQMSNMSAQQQQQRQQAQLQSQQFAAGVPSVQQQQANQATGALECASAQAGNLNLIEQQMNAARASIFIQPPQAQQQQQFQATPLELQQDQMAPQAPMRLDARGYGRAGLVGANLVSPQAPNLEGQSVMSPVASSELMAAAGYQQVYPGELAIQQQQQQRGEVRFGPGQASMWQQPKMQQQQQRHLVDFETDYSEHALSDQEYYAAEPGRGGGARQRAGKSCKALVDDPRQQQAAANARHGQQPKHNNRLASEAYQRGDRSLQAYDLAAGHRGAGSGTGAPGSRYGQVSKARQLPQPKKLQIEERARVQLPQANSGDQITSLDRQRPRSRGESSTKNLGPNTSSSAGAPGRQVGAGRHLQHHSDPSNLSGSEEELNEEEDLLNSVTLANYQEQDGQVNEDSYDECLPDEASVSKSRQTPARGKSPGGATTRANSNNKEAQQEAADKSNDETIRKLLSELKLKEQANQVLEQQQFLIKQSQELIKLQLEQQALSQEFKKSIKQGGGEATGAADVPGGSSGSEATTASASKQADEQPPGKGKGNEQVVDRQSSLGQQQSAEAGAASDGAASERLESSGKSRQKQYGDGSMGATSGSRRYNNNNNDETRTPATQRALESTRKSASFCNESDIEDSPRAASKTSRFSELNDQDSQPSSAFGAPERQGTTNGRGRERNELRPGVAKRANASAAAGAASSLPMPRYSRDLLQSPTDTTDSDVETLTQAQQRTLAPSSHSRSRGQQGNVRQQQQQQPPAAGGAQKLTVRRREPTGLPPSPLPVAAAIQLHQMQQQHFRHQLNNARAGHASMGSRQGNYLRSRSVTSSPNHHLEYTQSGYLTDSAQRIRSTSPDTLSEFGGQRRRKRLPEPPSNAVPITPSMVRKMIQAQRTGGASGAKLLNSVTAQSTMITNAHGVGGGGSGRQTALTTTIFNDNDNTNQSTSQRFHGADTLHLTEPPTSQFLATAAANQPSGSLFTLQHLSSSMGGSNAPGGSYTASVGNATAAATTTTQGDTKQGARSASAATGPTAPSSDLNKFLTSTYGNSILKNNNISDVKDTPELDKLISNLDEYYGLDSKRHQTRLPLDQSHNFSESYHSSALPTATSGGGYSGLTTTISGSPVVTREASALYSSYQPSASRPSAYPLAMERSNLSGSLLRRNSEGESNLAPRITGRRGLASYRGQTSFIDDTYKPVVGSYIRNNNLISSTYGTQHDTARPSSSYLSSTLSPVGHSPRFYTNNTSSNNPPMNTTERLRLSDYQNNLSEPWSSRSPDDARFELGREARGSHYYRPSQSVDHHQHHHFSSPVGVVRSLQHHHPQASSSFDSDRLDYLASGNTSTRFSEQKLYTAPTTLLSDKYRPYYSSTATAADSMRDKYRYADPPLGSSDVSKYERGDFGHSSRYKSDHNELNVRRSHLPGAGANSVHFQPRSFDLESSTGRYTHQNLKSLNAPLSPYESRLRDPRMGNQLATHEPTEAYLNDPMRTDPLSSTGVSGGYNSCLASQNYSHQPSYNGATTTTRANYSSNNFVPLTKDDIIKSGPKFNSIGYRFRTENQNKYVAQARSIAPIQCLQSSYPHPYKRILLSKNPKDRIGNGIGVRIRGGQAMPSLYDSVNRCIVTSGAFVTEVFQDSNVYFMDELHEGDQIIEWNGVNLCNRSDEEVQQILLSQFSDDEVEIVYLNQSKFNEAYSMLMNGDILSDDKNYTTETNATKLASEDPNSDLFDTYSEAHKAGHHNQAASPNLLSRGRYLNEMGTPKSQIRRKLSLSSFAHMWSR